MWNLKKKKANQKKPQLIDTENRLVFARGGSLGMGERGEERQKIPTPSFKINKTWGCDLQCGIYS